MKTRIKGSLLIGFFAAAFLVLVGVGVMTVYAGATLSCSMPGNPNPNGYGCFPGGACDTCGGTWLCNNPTPQGAYSCSCSNSCVGGGTLPINEITLSYLDGSGNTHIIGPTGGMYDIPSNVTTLMVNGTSTGNEVDVFCSVDQSVSKSFNENVDVPNFEKWTIDGPLQDNTLPGGPLLGNNITNWSYVQRATGSCNGSSNATQSIAGQAYIVNYNFNVGLTGVTQNVTHQLNIGFFSSEGGAAGGCNIIDQECIPQLSASNSPYFEIIPATSVGISIAPTSATVQTSNTQTFTATVTGSANTQVTWLVNGIAGGNTTLGTISIGGVYTAPASVPSPATVTVTAQSQADVTKSASATVTVTAAAAFSGTVNVSSMNSVTGQSVAGTWDVSGATDLGDKTTYSNAPLSPPPYNFVALTASDPAGPYVMDNVCAAVNRAVNTGTDCLVSPGSALGFSLANNGDTENLVALWNPVATMTVTPSILLTTATPSGQVILKNMGAPGSVLSNLTDTLNPASASSWLSVSSLGGVSVNQGASTNPTITVNTAAAPASCSTGCTVTITFTGQSSPGVPATQPSAAVNITYTSSGGGGGPISITIVPPPPTTIAVNVPVQVSCSGGTGSYSWSSAGGSFSTTNSTAGQTIQVTYGAIGTYTVTCTDTSSAKASTQVVVVPACTLFATPPSVVPPEQSELSWNCQPNTANSCSISGTNVQNSSMLSGTTWVSPTASQNYTLSCIANNGLGTLMTATTTVTVGGPIIHE
jgi:hypothetical protein